MLQWRSVHRAYNCGLGRQHSAACTQCTTAAGNRMHCRTVSSGGWNIHKTLGLQLWFLPRDAMQTLPMPSCGSLSVCLCDVRLVTFVNSVETNKRRATFKIFSPSGSQAILHFSYKSAWQYYDGNHHDGGVECRNRDSEPTSGFTAATG